MAGGANVKLGPEHYGALQTSQKVLSRPFVQPATYIQGQQHCEEIWLCTGEIGAWLPRCLKPLCLIQGGLCIRKKFDYQRTWCMAGTWLEQQGLLCLGIWEQLSTSKLQPKHPALQFLRMIAPRCCDHNRRNNQPSVVTIVPTWHSSTADAAHSSEQ